MTRFPDSWILSILPLLVRIVVSLFALTISKTRNFYRYCTNVDVNASAILISLPHGSKLSTSIKRLFFYFVIIQYRGWILYVFMNDVMIPRLRRRQIQEHDMQQSSCWYSDYLLRKNQNNVDSACYGQKFDFSDHIVLFYSHLLPLLVFEALFCLKYPFWPLSVIYTGDEDKKDQDNNKISTRIVGLLNTMIPVFLCTAIGYLNVLIWLSTTITAAYFHTATESITGYLLSLTVQIPIGYIIFASSISSSKTSSFQEFIAWIQYFVGISSEREHLD